MESNEQNKLINKIETDSDTENKLTAVSGEGLGDWVKTVKGLSKKSVKTQLIDTDNSMVITRGTGSEGR